MGKKMKLIILWICFLLSFAALAESPLMGALLMRYETELICKDGTPRIRKVYHTTNLGIVSDVQNPSLLSPNSYEEGAIESQNTGNLYFGSSAFNDILVVQPVRDEKQKIVGANIYLSFCQFNPLIHSDRPLSNFQTPTGMVLTENYSACPHGNVIALTATLSAAQFENYPATSVVTDFAGSNSNMLRICNGYFDTAISDKSRQNGAEIPNVQPIANENPGNATPR